MNAKFSE